MSTVPPRAQSVPQRRIERRFPPYQSGALPLDDCGLNWCSCEESNPAPDLTRAAHRSQSFSFWCWSRDSNPAPAAYKAAALSDELNQPNEQTAARPFPIPPRGAPGPRCGGGSRAPARRLGERPVPDVHDVKQQKACVPRAARAVHAVSSDLSRSLWAIFAPPAFPAEGLALRRLLLPSRPWPYRSGLRRLDWRAVAHDARARPIARPVEGPGGGRDDAI